MERHRVPRATSGVAVGSARGDRRSGGRAGRRVCDQSADNADFETLPMQLGKTTSFTADGTAEKQGGTDRYPLPPVADEVEADYVTEPEA